MMERTETSKTNDYSAKKRLEMEEIKENEEDDFL